MTDKCVIWPYAKDRDGYGYFKSGGYGVRAHRALFAMFCGPIPEGMCVLHSCDRRDCINPAHLRLGTHAENMADMVSKGRHSHGARQPHAKLTDAAVLAIRASAMTLREIAAVHGISKTTASEIRRREKWRHVA